MLVSQYNYGFVLQFFCFVNTTFDKLSANSFLLKFRSNPIGASAKLSNSLWFSSTMMFFEKRSKI